ncbi:SCO-spondin-like isoform X2 [Passer montanus]|uniref:SCO-spondin-like isoform X2 n=1 Tax=Passer montanus TaxID=9160 RepID=UPI001960150D|nr:SCO-spondin-like isoform X2 [Passer montanus]
MIQPLDMWSLHCPLTAVLCWQVPALAWMVHRGERCVHRNCLALTCHGAAVVALAVPGQAVYRCCVLGCTWPGCVQVCGCTWPDCTGLWLYLAGLCTGVMFLAVPARLCTGVVCQVVCTGTVCPVPCVLRCCVPGCTWLGWAVCAASTFWVRLSQCRVCHCGSWHTRGVSGAGSGKGTPSPAIPTGMCCWSCCQLSLSNLSPPPALSFPGCLSKGARHGGEIPATCGGAASHQHFPGSATVTQHRCGVVSCLSGPAALALLPQGGCSPGAAKVPGHLLLIPRTVFGKIVVVGPGSCPGSLRMRFLHDPSMTLQGSDTAILNASAVCRVPRHQYLLWPRSVPCHWIPASPVPLCAVSPDSSISYHSLCCVRGFQHLLPHSVLCPWIPASPAPLCTVPLDSSISYPILCCVPRLQHLPWSFHFCPRALAQPCMLHVGGPAPAPGP